MLEHVGVLRYFVVGVWVRTYRSILRCWGVGGVGGGNKGGW